MTSIIKKRVYGYKLQYIFLFYGKVLQVRAFRKKNNLNIKGTVILSMFSFLGYFGQNIKLNS